MVEPITLQSYRDRDETARRLNESMRRQLGDFYRYLDDPEVSEISLNPDGKVWIDRIGHPLECVGDMQPEAAENFIGTVAATVRRVIDYDHPNLQCRLPLGGHRFQAACPPTTPAWVFSIRCHASAVFPLDDYEEKGIITDLQHEAVIASLIAKHNMFITGEPGSGKTTFLNSLLWHPVVIPDRVIICEDTPELRWGGTNVVPMCTNNATSMRDLVVQSLRMRPDRLVIGETREGGPFLETLKAMAVGCRGCMTTLHANSVRHALSRRMEMLIREVSTDPLRDLIAETVKVIIHFEKLNVFPFRRATEIKTVLGHSNGKYELQPLADYVPKPGKET